MYLPPKILPMSDQENILQNFMFIAIVLLCAFEKLESLADTDRIEIAARLGSEGSIDNASNGETRRF